jgi:flagellar basal body rod protein FlgB
MKKVFYSIAIICVAAVSTDAMAQDKKADASVAKTEQTAENKAKEADALKARIVAYTEKVEANKGNESVDYDAEMVRIAQMKRKWETLTGETWKEEEKK